MTLYGKTAQTAIAAVSRLAQLYDPEKPVKQSSADIARSRQLPQPVVAKVLVTLAQAGLIVGSPGPGGGYTLARPPEQITFADVARLFERLDDQLSCPFGPQWCGLGPQCPVHDQLVILRSQTEAFLNNNTFAPFVGWKEQEGHRVAEPPARPAKGINIPLIPPPRRK